MAFKILGCVFILIGCSLIGYIYGEILKNRVIQLRQIEQALYQIENEIVYTRTSLPDVFYNIGEKCSSPINNIFFQTSNLLKKNEVDSVYEALKKTFKINEEIISLKKDDINILLDMSKTLGVSDIEGQRSILSLTINNLKKQIVDAELLMKKNIKMYRYLGFSFGAILVIMIL